jgi:hypothetical protein
VSYPPTVIGDWRNIAIAHKTMITASFGGSGRFGNPKDILIWLGICVFFYVLGKLWPVKRPPGD